ncbi:sigma 54-interacting transcriptional regulator [Pediococcus acidilactici]|uniref:sigma 54-interacting transcriptional regulator n=1 Tax=Pediococcus acidilactici TaxID=1254 RepID=UPI0006B51124|nr:sigma 54-interacting transcriptional regulator [Pediococcus acidilactici]KAF0370983.1 PRD domain-containing protein [Pediococcus acidilactici]KAF0382224.1 PRD domain-containing protein [Pediococcus acidilactici]KAF0455745.1 PRD domain-containing protein [Pediococcus acidilactici]KAF0475540.1 PRD domain-containing protein [Pediococcus acidilactici]KAF0535520.1 PRD domain-containing protein [Pediococcus acidilactici]
MKERTKDIFKLLKKKTTEYLGDLSEKPMTSTEVIAKKLGLTRTVVSKELNALYKDNLLIKINTRPVIFLAMEGALVQLLRKEYPDLSSFYKDYHEQRIEMYLRKIIGWDRSLKKQVEQIKASLVYPENGLPTIIFGESGTGKSFFVRCAYEYAVAAGILDTNAPFVTINCAQYANNPELLSSVLFGYTQGAFTGATEAKDGALLKANNGILFLDEVHRLNPEGQEKLFTYMDTGKFTLLGDDAHKISSNTRLMFATTEKPDRFLDTFLRRVPIRINMPTLEERSFFEKKELINNFIMIESKRIKRPIKVTNKALLTLYEHIYVTNVGEVKNLIKSIVATTYSNQITNRTIKISTHDLPDIFYKDLENNISHKKVPMANLEAVFDWQSKKQKFAGENDPIVSKLKQAWKYIKKMDNQQIRDSSKYVFFVKNLMNHLYFSVVKSDDVMFTHTINETQKILKLMQYDEEIYENSNFVYGISVYIYYVLNANLDWTSNVEISSGLKQLFAKQYTFIEHVQPLLEKEFEVVFSQSDLLWLAMMIFNERVPDFSTPVVVMAHGYATASSIADTSNGILRYPIFHGIDMLPSASAEDMAESLKKVISRTKPSKGIVIMVDMGSLSTVAKNVTRILPYPMLLIDKVSTPIAIDVGNKLQQGRSLEEIEQGIARTKYKCLFLNGQATRPNVIISTCMTGIGTAEQIQKLLTKSFQGIIQVEVITCEFSDLKRGISEEKNKYNVLGIIGIDDPGISDVPYLGLEDIISGTKMEELKAMLLPISSTEAIKKAEQQLIKNFSLNRVMDSLTIISPEKVMPVLEKFIAQVKKDLKKPLNNKTQIALYVHLGSMVERLVRGEGIKTFKGDNESIIRDDVFSVLKSCVSVLEDPFIIKVSDPEIAYIREIIVNS